MGLSKVSLTGVTMAFSMVALMALQIYLAALRVEAMDTQKAHGSVELMEP